MLTNVENNDLSAIAASKIAFVDMNAVWCGPCRMLGPVVDELADEYDGRVDFYSVDVDENPAIAQKFGVSSIPALFILKDGAVAAQAVGFRPKAQLKAWLDENV